MFVLIIFLNRLKSISALMAQPPTVRDLPTSLESCEEKSTVNIPSEISNMPKERAGFYFEQIEESFNQLNAHTTGLSRSDIMNSILDRLPYLTENRSKLYNGITGVLSKYFTYNISSRVFVMNERGLKKMQSKKNQCSKSDEIENFHSTVLSEPLPIAHFNEQDMSALDVQSQGTSKHSVGVETAHDSGFDRSDFVDKNSSISNDTTSSYEILQSSSLSSAVAPGGTSISGESRSLLASTFWKE
jgi:hypothetical protein